METVLIVGATGQDGAYLSKLLLEKGFKVIGTSRDASVCDTSRLQKLNVLDDIEIISLAPNDFRNVLKVISSFNPAKIFNLSGQTSVGLSFDQPVECMDSIAGSTINFLEALRFLKADIKFFNAGSTECFGDTYNKSATEDYPFKPCSPYAVAKSTAYWLVANYRIAYGIFCCTGILSNHESPLRPNRFVTKKIVKQVSEIKSGLRDSLSLGNVNIHRDWGWAPEYVKAMYLMLESSTADDYIISSGSSNSLKKFVNLAFQYFDLNPEEFIKIDNSFIRPADISYSAMNPKKILKNLGWKAEKDLDYIVKSMIENKLY